jgi:hypothetical protein
MSILCALMNWGKQPKKEKQLHFVIAVQINSAPLEIVDFIGLFDCYAQVSKPGSSAAENAKG